MYVQRSILPKNVFLWALSSQVGVTSTISNLYVYDGPQALFDGCVVNADSPSLQNSSLEAIFNQRKQRKNKTYKEAAEARRATFSPIIATCDAVFDKEAEIYFKHLAVYLSQKWKSNYSVTLGFIRARMQLFILRSVSLCLRGSRTKWRGAGVEGGAALATKV